MTLSQSERYDYARRLFEHRDFRDAAREFGALVDATVEDPTLHGTAELRLYLARSYYHSAQLNRAEATLRGLLADQPTDAYAHLVLGRTLQRQSRHDEAKHHLAMASLLGGYATDSSIDAGVTDDDGRIDDE